MNEPTRARLAFLRLGASLLLLATLPCTGLGCSDEDENEGDPGPSGVARGKYLDELTAAERRSLCEWATPALGGPGESECGGLTIRTPTVAECVEDENQVHCTVAQTEDCVRSTGGDRCRSLSSEACLAYLACALENGAELARRIPFGELAE